MFYVESGRVITSAVVPSGKEAVTALRGDGDFFGTRSLVAQQRTATATTLTDCALVRLTKATLIRVLREQPDFAELFTIYLMRQSLQDQENLIDHLTNSAEKRLARVLLQLAECGGHSPTLISQDVLAKMIGTTRSRVSFFMNKFRRQGYIEYNRYGYVVRNSQLAALLTS